MSKLTWEDVQEGLDDWNPVLLQDLISVLIFKYNKHPDSVFTLQVTAEIRECKDE